MSKKPQKPRQRKRATLPELVQAVLVPARTPGDPSYHKWGATYQTEFSRLTKPQLEAIGRVASNWSVLEWLLETLLSRLALAPSFPACALTNDLSPDNRLRAIEALIRLHRGRYRLRIVNRDTLEAIGDLLKIISRLKDDRNRIVHWVWSRITDEEIFGIRYRANAPSHLVKETTSAKLSVSDINATAQSINDAADVLFVLCGRIPEIAESLPLQFLLQEQGRHHRGTE